MRRVQTKQTLKLRLLAFVLALALLWYSLNPTPRVVIRKKQDDEPPDEKKQNVEPHNMPATSSLAFRRMGQLGESSSTPIEDEDDFEWPEFIDG
jgi:hypothetical protein